MFSKWWFYLVIIFLAFFLQRPPTPIFHESRDSNKTSSRRQVTMDKSPKNVFSRRDHSELLPINNNQFDFRSIINFPLRVNVTGGKGIYKNIQLYSSSVCSPLVRVILCASDLQVTIYHGCVTCARFSIYLDVYKNDPYIEKSTRNCCSICRTSSRAFHNGFKTALRFNDTAKRLSSSQCMFYFQF